MLEQSILQNYLDILREELVPATGCTEPIAIAYCAATLREPPPLPSASLRATRRATCRSSPP